MSCGRIPGPICQRLEDWWKLNSPVIQWQPREAVDDPPKDPAAGDQRVVPGSKWLPNLIVALDKLDNSVTLRAKGDRANVTAEKVPLKSADQKGTPPGQHPGNRVDVVKIKNLQVTGNASDGKVSAIGTLSITNPGDPAHLTEPLDLEFRLSTSGLSLSGEGASQRVAGLRENVWRHGQRQLHGQVQLRQGATQAVEGGQGFACAELGYFGCA